MLAIGNCNSILVQDEIFRVISLADVLQVCCRRCGKAHRFQPRGSPYQSHFTANQFSLHHPLLAPSLDQGRWLCTPLHFHS